MDMIMLKSNGLRTLPCGRPFVTVLAVDIVELTFTAKVLLFRYAARYLSGQRRIPMSAMFLQDFVEVYVVKGRHDA